MSGSRKRLLIWGTTYPEFSKKYYETVCTGAIDGESGKLLRLYPITLRHFAEPFHLYNWIEAEIERNTGDHRPESHRIRQDTIAVREKIEAGKGWVERSRWVLQSGNVFHSVEDLWDAQKRDHTSLGLVKPKEIIRRYSRKKPDSERDEWDEQRSQALKQKDLYVDAEAMTKDLKFMPVEYRICFRCDDDRCNSHDMSIRDWGTYALSRKQYATRGGAVGAEKGVIDKLTADTDLLERDLYFFLGNMIGHPGSFMVVGLFSPPFKYLKPTTKEKPTTNDGQLSMDFSRSS